MPTNKNVNDAALDEKFTAPVYREIENSARRKPEAIRRRDLQRWISVIASASCTVFTGRVSSGWRSKRFSLLLLLISIVIRKRRNGECGFARTAILIKNLDGDGIEIKCAICVTRYTHRRPYWIRSLKMTSYWWGQWTIEEMSSRRVT